MSKQQLKRGDIKNGLYFWRYHSKSKYELCVTKAIFIARKAAKKKYYEGYKKRNKEHGKKQNN